MSNWSEKQVQQVWEKGKTVPNNDKDKFRKDFAGAWIKRDEHGNQDSIYGWQIDHQLPVDKKGCDSICNLQPLQWNNNQTKGNDFPGFKTSVTSKDNTNIEKTQSWKYNQQQVNDLKSCCDLK